MKPIYFDNSASTQVDPQVLEAMLPYLQDEFGNPSSAHSYGQRAQSAVDEARENVAKHLRCLPAEVIFTSGATESNNLAIQGVVNYYSKDGKIPHIITSKIEHPAILEVFEYLNKAEKAEISYIGVDEHGVLKLDELKQAIQHNTLLISVMYANNEVGAIQPIAEIGELVKSVRAERDKNFWPLYLHTDAVQAFNYLNMDVNELGVDLLSFSGHKIHAPKGVGALYIRKGVKIQPVNFGGHHEYNLRPGTLNVPGIVALGKAVELITVEREANAAKVLKIKNLIIQEFADISEARYNGAGETQLPNLINVSFYKAEGESILMMLDLDGIAVSTGSACSSGSLEPSHVLTAMGIIPEWAHGSVRISLGKFNSEEEVPIFVASLKKAVDRLRKMAP